MAKSVKAVREKRLKLMEASRKFSVPKSILFRLRLQTEASRQEVSSNKMSRKSILPENLEKELVKYLLLMETKFYCLTRNDIRRMAYHLAERNHIPNPFTGYIASRAWFDHFINRYKDKLSIRKHCGISIARAKGFNKDNVGGSFDILEDEFGKHNFPDDRVYNVDETGLNDSSE